MHILVGFFCFMMGVLNIPMIFGGITTQKSVGYINIIALIFCWSLAAFLFLYSR